MQLAIMATIVGGPLAIAFVDLLRRNLQRGRPETNSRPSDKTSPTPAPSCSNRAAGDLSVFSPPMSMVVHAAQIPIAGLSPAGFLPMMRFDARPWRQPLIRGYALSLTPLLPCRAWLPRRG
jgi:hypothetical protein